MVKTIAVLSILLCVSVTPAIAGRHHSKTKPEVAQAKLTPPQSVQKETCDDTNELIVNLEMPDKTAAKSGEKVSEANRTSDEDTQTSVDASSIQQPEIPVDQDDLKNSARSERQARLVKEALAYRGTPYVWGGEGRLGFDCSGFTQFLYAKRGIKLPHSAKMQFERGNPVSKEELQDGDLVFFNTRGPITHVGMYIGNGQFVHAANPRRGVTVSELSNTYYTARYAGARRYAKG